MVLEHYKERAVRNELLPPFKYTKNEQMFLTTITHPDILMLANELTCGKD